MTRKTSLLALVVTVALISAGVGSVGASVQEPSVESASQTQGDDIRVRIVHASPDAPPVDVSVDGEVVASSLDFGEEASAAVDEPGNHSVEIAASDDETAVDNETTAANETVADNETAAEDEGTALYSENVTFESGTDYTIAVAGEVTEGAQTAFEPVVLTENATTVGEGDSAVGLVHLSPDAPSVDVTENETGEVVFENVSYAEATEQVTLPAGNYTLDVRVESEDNDGEIVDSFDVSLAGGSTYTAFAIGYVETENVSGAENVSADRSFTLLLSEDAATDDDANATDDTVTPSPSGEETVTEPGTATEPSTETPIANETDTPTETGS